MIDMRITRLFFDRKAVTNRAGRATKRVLSRFGAYVRQTARRSIRKRKAVSPPGQPPSSHKGLLKRFIFFGYEPARQSVVIGPARLAGRNRGEAPPLLEYGGRTTLKRDGRRKRATYKARPFMTPAFEVNKKQLPSMWANSVR